MSDGLSRRTLVNDAHTRVSLLRHKTLYVNIGFRGNVICSVCLFPWRSCCVYNFDNSSSSSSSSDSILCVCVCTTYDLRVGRYLSYCFSLEIRHVYLVIFCAEKSSEPKKKIEKNVNHFASETEGL